MLQHNRLDANSFISVKLWKQTKNCTNIYEGPVKKIRDGVFFRAGRQLEAQEFFALKEVVCSHESVICLFDSLCLLNNTNGLPASVIFFKTWAVWIQEI